MESWISATSQARSGNDDLAIGSPHEDKGLFGRLDDVGGMHVLYGLETQGLREHASKYFDQSGGIKGSREDDDQFGRALAAGDFNGDGYEDLAIGSPTTDTPGINNIGAVIVIYGSPDRLQTEERSSTAWSSTIWLPGRARSPPSLRAPSSRRTAS